MIFKKIAEKFGEKIALLTQAKGNSTEIAEHSDHKIEPRCWPTWPS
jgi:hypothetical protein